MTWIYAAAAIFGWVFLVPMLLSGLDIGGADLDVEGGEVDLDIDGDVEIGDADGGGDGVDVDGGPLGAVFASLVSFRTLVFFAAFFGAAGLAFTGLDYGSFTTLLSSLIVGGFAGVSNSVLFGLVKNSESTSQLTDRILQGRPAVVVLPMGDGRPGRIRVDLGGQPQFLVARPVDDGLAQRFDVGASVVVVEIENGTAMVTSLAGLGLGEE